MNTEKIPLWRDQRVLKIAGQLLLVLFVAIALFFLASNLVRNFNQLGLSFGFDFLTRPTSFAIGDTVIPFQSTDPYTKAILVGLLNSLRVIIIGLIFATIFGVTVGIARLADNWLVRQIATVYVELLRNTPLLLQLFFWYFAVFLNLPKIENPLILPGGIFLTNRGMDIPWPAGNIQTWLSLAFLLVSAIILVILKPLGNQVIPIVGVAVLVLLFGLDWQQPQLMPQESIITGGLNLSPELATLTIGLIVYTSAFIAEVVRAGIQSVNKGQWEAAKALGLKPLLVMQLVIFPQALRVMIPPLTSEFLNLAKNSSLALAIGYNDIYAISNTISNQTGRSVEMLLIVIGTYLIINLIISTLMNWFNRVVQIKER